MDFLRIRDKAKKAKAASEAKPAEAPVAASSPEPVATAARPPPAPPEPLPAAPPPAPAPAVEDGWNLAAPPPLIPVQPASEVDALEGALAARLQGLPPAGTAVHFATWRPGAGAPPDVPAGQAPASDPLTPSDFQFVRPPQTSAREPFQPPLRAPPPVDPDPLPAAIVPPRPPAADPLDEFLYRDDEDAPAVPGFEGALEEAARPAAADVREEYITFLLGAEEYAVAIERVREVLRCPPLTEVPRAPNHVRGVVSVRGEVVAVVEPRRRLGLPDAERAPESSRLLVVDVGDGPVGLLVDAVSSVVRLKPGSIEPCPQGIGGASQEFLAGIGREADRLFTVLDLGALLRRSAALRRRPEGAPRAG
ncbi:MAG: chemotaxis protein CheW [Anaeromyxobacteraceae bacterium]